MLCRASSLSRRHYLSGLRSEVLKMSCAAVLQTSVCLTGVVTTLIMYSVRNDRTLKYSDSLFPHNEIRIICLYRIITETCTHVLLNHHFINTYSIPACLNPYRVIFREFNGYFSNMRQQNETSLKIQVRVYRVMCYASPMQTGAEGHPAP